MKFIRVNGRVVPIKGEGSAPKGSGVSKRYGAKPERAKPAKQIGVAKGAAFGAVAGLASSIYKKKTVSSIVGSGIFKHTSKLALKKGYGFAAAIGAIAGAAVGSIKVYKKKRGESDMQAAKRAGKYK